MENSIEVPSLVELAAMKAYSLGRRSKWKDYVDLYFLLRDQFSLETISQKAKDLFGAGFNEKLFREQLTYYEDIDFSEKVDFIGSPVSEEKIKAFLTQVAIQ